MRKVFLTLTMLAALSVSASADGQIGMTKSSCPPGQTCVLGQIGMTGATGEAGDSASQPHDAADETVTVKSLIESIDIFGIAAYLTNF